VALQQSDQHVAAVSPGVPELESLWNQPSFFGTMDCPAVLSADTLARISNVDFTMGCVELVD
jgi:hypothetical protein